MESLPRIQDAYRKMYPYANFKLEVIAQKVVRCLNYCSPPQYTRTSLLFTGGVDATSALIEEIEDNPLLINIWGGDVSVKDMSSHAELESYLDGLSKAMNLQYVFIKSNCREQFNESRVTKMLATKIFPWHNHGWWASIAHILSMSTLVAPLSYVAKIGINYIASSYDAKSSTFDANNDTLLAAIRFGECKLEPVDSNLERAEKVKKIIDFSSTHKIKLDLKVCWFRKAGKNCSHCEKCYRTVLEILAAHGDPNAFGFAVSTNTYREVKEYVKTNYVNTGFWKPIQAAFEKERDYWLGQPEISWILDAKLNSVKALARKVVTTMKKFI